MHWTFRDDKTRVTDPDNYFGFVYVISNKLTTRQYIGCKQYWHMRKRKRHKPSNWRVYISSSTQLNYDINKLGKRNFKFEIIQEYLTKRGLHYYEQYYQMKYHVLTAIIKSTGEKAYYNKNVGGIRFYCPVEKYEDPEYKKKRSELSKAQWADPEYRKRHNEAHTKPEYKKKRSELSKAQWSTPEFRKRQSEARKGNTNSYKGPYRITFDTGESIIVSKTLGKWAESNGYNISSLSRLLGGKPRFDKRYGKAYKVYRHKDIVKVERLSDEEE